MLKVEHRFMIKTLYQRGLSISEIAEITGHNRRTIRKIVNGPVSPQPQKRKVRESKLDRFVPHLNTTTTDESRTATLVCSDELANPAAGRMGLFGALVTTLGIVQPVPELNFRPRALRQQLAQDPRQLRAGELGRLFPPIPAGDSAEMRRPVRPW